MVEEIGLALEGIKVALDIGKYIKNTKQLYDNAEVQLKIAELISSLAETKVKLADITLIISNKDEEISKLKQLLEDNSKMKFEKYYYFCEPYIRCIIKVGHSLLNYRFLSFARPNLHNCDKKLYRSYLTECGYSPSICNPILQK